MVFTSYLKNIFRKHHHTPYGKDITKRFNAMKRFGFCLLDIDIDDSFRTITWDIEFFSQFYVYEIPFEDFLFPLFSIDLTSGKT